ncbi:MAG: heavy metal-binding domain-containing protein [Candidatus Dormibacteria bacterium]
MRFFRGGQGPRPSPEEQAREQERAEKSQKMVEAGGIPLDAQERIERQLGRGGVWTSDLSVDELAALRGIDYEPVAQVLGSSLYRVGWINTGLAIGPRYGGMGFPSAYGAMEPVENQGLTRALIEARRRAIHRLELEAQALKADGVVGVRLKISNWDWAQGLSEFTVLGTAVRRRGHAGGEERPFTSTLTGQDMSKLVSSGYAPLRLVMGASAQQAMMVFTYAGWYNREIGPFTRALHIAQTAANHRIGLEAGEAGARGVVGVTFTSNIVEYSTGSEAVLGRIVQWVMLGTAVRPQPASQPVAAPRLVMPLRPRGETGGGSNVP